MLLCIFQVSCYHESEVSLTGDSIWEVGQLRTTLIWLGSCVYHSHQYFVLETECCLWYKVGHTSFPWPWEYGMSWFLAPMWNNCCREGKVFHYSNGYVVYQEKGRGFFDSSSQELELYIATRKWGTMTKNVRIKGKIKMQSKNKPILVVQER